MGGTVRWEDAASAAGVPVDLDIPHVFHAAVLLAESAHPPTATTFLHRLASWTSRLPAAP